MIIKGGSRSNGRFFAKHLTNDRDEKNGNGRVELREMRGVTAQTVDGFFREIGAIAGGVRCKDHFYHANLNPEGGEKLTSEQWKAAVDRLEKNLGLAGHARFVIEHEKHGRTHQHVIWSRVNTDTMKVWNDWRKYPVHERTAREIEIEFGLSRMQNSFDRDGPKPGPRRKDWEGFRASQKAVIGPTGIKSELTELWQTTDSGRAFAAALDERGYALARGDRRDFVVLDHAGDVHSLARCIDGVKAAGVRERLADVDLAALPSVTEAREKLRSPFTRDGHFDRPAAVQAWHDRGIEPVARDVESARPSFDPAPVLLPMQRPGAASDDRVPPARQHVPADAPAREHGGVSVTNGAARLADGLAEVALSILDALFGGGEKPPPNPYMEQIEARERALAALENIRVSMERDGRVSVQDLRNLDRQNLTNFSARGGDALRELLRRDDDDREHRMEGGRER